MRFYLASLLMVSSGAFAREAVSAPPSDWKVASPRKIYVDVYKNDRVSDPYLYPIDADLAFGGNFAINFDIVKYKSYNLFWDNLLHFDQSSETGRVVHGGWQFELGLTLYAERNNPKIQVFHQHHSRHIFEATRDTLFPVYDRAGLRFNIYP